MPQRSSYTSDEIESCRDHADSLLAAWAANDVEDDTLEVLVFTSAVVVLDAWFAHRVLPGDRTDGSAIAEVRVLADSVVGNGGILRVDGPVPWAPERSVLRLAVGDEIEVRADGFERLAAAYLSAIEATYRHSGG